MTHGMKKSYITAEKRREKKYVIENLMIRSKINNLEASVKRSEKNDSKQIKKKKKKKKKSKQKTTKKTKQKKTKKKTKKKKQTSGSPEDIFSP